MTIHIDMEKANALLTECVAERGESYVYEKPLSYHGYADDCAYVHDYEVTYYDEDGRHREATPELMKPGCLIGLALNKAGVELGAFLDLQVNNEDSHAALDALQEASVLTYDKDAAELLNRAQMHQDKGVPWGEAVELARYNR